MLGLGLGLAGFDLLRTSTRSRHLTIGETRDITHVSRKARFRMRRYLSTATVECGVLAFSASSAFAESNGEFLVGGVPAKLTAVKSHSSRKILLEDMTGKAAVECEAADEGVVGGNSLEEKAKLDETTKVGFVNCVSRVGCAAESDIEVLALNLPWRTELAVANKGMAGERVLDVIAGSGAGSPGYEVKCLVAGILISDKCTKASATVEIANGANDINALFNTGEEAECSLGGAKSGLVEAAEVIETVGGAALQVS